MVGLGMCVNYKMRLSAERCALGLDLGIVQVAVNDAAPRSGMPLSEQVDAFERSLIASELLNPHQSLREVAQALQLPRKTLHDKLRKYGLELTANGDNPPTTQS